MGWEAMGTAAVRDAGGALVAGPRGPVAVDQLEERIGGQRLRAQHALARPDAGVESSRATIGFMAVCQTTACEPNSDMHQALSTTWWR